MKTPRALLFTLPAAFALSNSTLHATDDIKANNTTALNLAGSWVDGSVPTALNGDVITWNSTVTVANTVAIGGNLDVLGIKVTNPGGAVSVTNATGNVMSLGASGIDMSTATQNVSLFTSAAAANVTIAANQTWNVQTGRSLTLFNASNTLNIRLTGSGNIEKTGSGTVVMQVGDSTSTGFALDNNGNDTFTGNWTITAGKVQSMRNGTHAWGRGGITLNGGQISQINGNWTWSNDITVSAASVIGNDSSNGLGRALKLVGSITSSNSSGLTFTNNVTGGTRTDSVGFILAGVNPSTYTTTTISANSRVRVGGNAENTTAGTGSDAGNRGTLGTGDVTLSAATSELAFTRTDAYSVANRITGSGTVVIGGNVAALAGTSTQVVTLSAASDYTGATRVSRSRLNLTGSLTSAVTVDNSGSISGTGSTTGLLTLASGSNIVLAGGGTTTSLTSGGVTFTGSNQVAFLSDPVPSQVYDVLTYGSGTVTNLGNLTAASRGTIANDAGSQKITFTAGAAGTRTWNSTTGTWAAGAAGTWSGGDNLYYNGDAAVFNDPASDSVVTLSGSINPGSVSVTNTNSYTFAGTSIGGSGGLSKSGGGTLVLQGANSYSGGTTLNGGTLQVENNTGLGTGALVINGGTLTTAALERQLANDITLNSNATLTGTAGVQGMRLNGVISGTGGFTKEGTGRITIANDSNSFTGPVTLNDGILASSLNALANSVSVSLGASGSLALGNNGSTSIKNLSGVAGSLIRTDFTISGGTGSRTLLVNQTVDGTYAGTFLEGGSRPISLTKSGAASLTLSGNNSYSGGTTVSAGTLVAGSSTAFGNGPITLSTGAVLNLNSQSILNTVTNNGGTIINALNLTPNQSGGSLSGSISGGTISGSIAGAFSASGSVAGTPTITGTLKGTATFAGAVTIGSTGIHAPGNSPGIETFAAGLTYDSGSTLQWEFAGNTLALRGTDFDGVDVTGGSLTITAGAILKVINLSAVDYASTDWDSVRNFTIVDNSGTGSTSGDFTLDPSGDISILGQGVWSILTTQGSGGDAILTWTPVPEPSTYAALAGLFVLGLAWKRRRV